MPNFTVVPVESSNLASVGHADNVLRVNFKNGTAYEYDGVPEQVFQDILGADSAGKTFNAKVKGVFPYRKVA